LLKIIKNALDASSFEGQQGLQTPVVQVYQENSKIFLFGLDI